MLLHSIVSPEYIFPYQPVNSVAKVANGYTVCSDGGISLFSTDPIDYINGKYISDNQILSNYIYSWRKN